MKLKYLLSLGRPINALMVFFAAMVGGYIADVPVSIAVWAALSAALISMGAQAINDYVDIEVDKRKRPHKPLPSGKVSPDDAKLAIAFYFLSGVVLGFLLSVYHGIIAVLASLLAIFYSYKLQRWKFLGNIVVSLLTALSIIYGGLLGNITRTVLPAFIVFLVNWGREILKDVEDGDADKGYKTTLYHLIGKDAILIGSYLIAMGVLLVPIPYVLNLLGEGYIVIMGVVSLFTLWFIAKMLSEMRPYHNPIKAAMLVGIIAFAAGV